MRRRWQNRPKEQHLVYKTECIDKATRYRTPPPAALDPFENITGINSKFPCTVEIFSQVNDVCWLEWRAGVTDDSTTRLQPDIQRSTQRGLWSPFARNHLLHQLHHHMLHDRDQHVHCNYPGKLQPSASRGGDWHSWRRLRDVLHSLVKVRFLYKYLLSVYSRQLTVRLFYIQGQKGIWL